MCTDPVCVLRESVFPLPGGPTWAVSPPELRASGRGPVPRVRVRTEVTRPPTTPHQKWCVSVTSPVTTSPVSRLANTGESRDPTRTLIVPTCPVRRFTSPVVQTCTRPHNTSPSSGPLWDGTTGRSRVSWLQRDGHLGWPSLVHGTCRSGGERQTVVSKRGGGRPDVVGLGSVPLPNSFGGHSSHPGLRSTDSTLVSAEVEAPSPQKPSGPNLPFRVGN